MANPNGGPGRHKGVPNKAAREIRAYMEERLGRPAPVELFEKALTLLEDGEQLKGTDMGLEMTSLGMAYLEKSISYAYPKLKAIEHTGQVVALPAPIEPGPPPIDAEAERVHSVGPP